MVLKNSGLLGFQTRNIREIRFSKKTVKPRTYSRTFCTRQEKKSNYLPKPLYLLGTLGVMSVNGMPLPVVDIDFLHPAKHEL